MNILEIKNNLVKIAYDVNDNLALSNFVIIEDTNSPYVAQVMNLKSDAAGNFAIVKLLFTFNEEGILKNYNGTAPSLKAVVSKLPSNELLDIIPADKPIFLGKLAQQEIPLKLDKSILDNNLLICSDNIENTFKLINNIIGQIDEKTVIIDPEGQFSFDEKVVCGKDFKLPLNSQAIDFIYENDLEDLDPVKKAVIQDIFLEVQNYIKTLPEKFIPFDTFLNVVDSQYKETNIPELVLLKNKLLKYKELDIFAQELKDVLSLSMAVEQYITPVIDLSVLPENLQKEVILYVYSVLNNINENIYVFAKTNNSNITKKLLKRYITKDNVNTVIICPHEFKYIQEAKELSQNFIFFAPLTLTHDFAGYNTYLSKLNGDEFVIYGAHTQNIPLIVEIADVPLNNPEQQEESNNDENEVLEANTDEFFEDDENTEILTEETAEIKDELHDELETDEAEEIQTDEISTDEIISDDEISDEIISDEIVNQEDAISEEIIEDNDLDDDTQVLENINLEDENSENNDNIEIIEDSNENVLEDDSIVVETLEQPETAQPDEEMIEQAVKDVDKAFYEKLPEDELESSDNDSLTEDDLNLLDDLADENIELAGEDDVEDTQTVPIYPADDIEDNVQTFEAGERVSTAKYGEGVVEKMIKYGNKMLCSIDFPNIGRRLLDPSMTEITRLDS